MLKNKEPNYSATIIKTPELIKVDGLDNLMGVAHQGIFCLVPKEYAETIPMGVIFPSECQLSEEFCRNNNLYRKPELNKDPDRKGYIEENRRVRSIKLKGNISTGLFLPLSSLEFLCDTDKLKEGDTFTHINGTEVCKKYTIKTRQSLANRGRGLKKKQKPIEPKLFPEYIDTDNYFRNKENYKDNDWVVVTQKIHGTSARFAHQKGRKYSQVYNLCNKLDDYILSYLDRRCKTKALRGFKSTIRNAYFNNVSNNLEKLFSAKSEYSFFAGSRRTIKGSNTDHYYDKDIWTEKLKEIQHLIPKNVVIYGEIIGWVNINKEIQKNYNYNLPKGTSKLYVYRVSMVNEDGYEHIFDWESTKTFCQKAGLNVVPEIWQGYHKDFNAEGYMNKKFVQDLKLIQCLPLGSKSPCDEGVVIRSKNYVTKAKSPKFLLHETKQLDSGELDLESDEQSS